MVQKAAPLINIRTSRPLELVCMDFLSVEPDSSNTKDILVITDHQISHIQVLTRTWRLVKQFRQGLKESMVGQLLETRADVASMVFPRQSMADCSTQVIYSVKLPTS